MSSAREPVDRWHSEAPWRVDTRGGEAIVRGAAHSSDRRVTVAWVNGGQPEWRGNGTLLAAAPDLLVAAEDAGKLITELVMRLGEFDGALPFRHDAIRQALDDAIAKAKGEAPDA